MPRAYERKFDWDEARALLAQGESLTDVARAMGVTKTAIYRIQTEDRLRRDYERSSEWIRQGRCPDCGAQATRHSKRLQLRCRPCAALFASTNVRDKELRCVTCREWKPDDQYPFNRGGNKTHRGRHDQCRACQTEQKRKWRAKNPDYEREYSRKRRHKQSEGAVPK